MELLDILIERQTKEDLSDVAFAERLGVSRALWTKTRARQRRISDSVLRGVLRAFPDLAEAVWQYQAARLGMPALNAPPLHEALVGNNP